MDKSKSEKLKEILNQTLSTEDIQKKLKEEQKKLSEDKVVKKNNTEEDIQKEKEISIDLKKLKEEDVVIPDIRKEKHQENKESNLLLYLVAIIALLLLLLTIYLFTKDIKNNNTATENIKQEKIDSNLIFEEKPKIDELAKKEITDVIENNSKNENKPIILKNSNANNQNEEKNIVEVKEKVVFKTEKINKDNFKKIYNSLKANTLKCYNFKAGDTFPNKDCKENIKRFLNINKDALRFEIIPVISKDDYILFKKLETNIKSLDKDFQNKIKEYLLRGLSRERVLEVSWEIKEILGEDVILTPTNYYVKSKKDNKGIIIKAYH